MERIDKDKLNIELKSTPEFISVFENFYDDSIFNDISTHYVNLAYEYEVGEIDNLSIEQHNEYK
jgi:colanic acid biosynthesis protein WcaH